MATEKNQTPADFTRSRARTDIDTLKAMYPEIRAKAFAVTGVEDFARLQRIQESVAKLSEGGNWNQLKNQIADEIGRDKDQVKEHAETVLRTNGFQAFASARYRKQQAMKSVFPFLKYVTVGDDRVRDSHAKLDGVILRADDPFWKDHYPPWGFNCRCLVIQLTEEDAKDEVDAGEGEMWNDATRQDFMARNRAIDETREFHFRPDSLEMDLRDIAAAKGRTPEMMKDFGNLMETRKIGTGEFMQDGQEITTNVREWMWTPVQKEYQAKAKADTEHENAYVLNAYTGDEIAHIVGTQHSVDIGSVKNDGLAKRVIHNHTSGNKTLSPGDLLTSMRTDIEHVEAVADNGWMRVSNTSKNSENMREMLKDWRRKLNEVAQSGDTQEIRKVRQAWVKWLAAQKKYGYIQIESGV